MRLKKLLRNLVALCGVRAGTHEITRVQHKVNLWFQCKLPFDSAVRETTWRGYRRVTLELREDDYLYLGGQRLVLHLVPQQKRGGRIEGYDLLKIRNQDGDNVPTQVLDYLIEHPELWPKRWKKDQNGKILYVCFWNDIFRNRKDGYLYVPCAFWMEGMLHADVLCLQHTGYYSRFFYSNYPAAVLES